MTPSPSVERNGISSLSACKLQSTNCKLCFETDNKMVVFWTLGYGDLWCWQYSTFIFTIVLGSLNNLIPKKCKAIQGQIEVVCSFVLPESKFYLRH